MLFATRKMLMIIRYIDMFGAEREGYIAVQMQNLNDLHNPNLT